MINHHPNGRFQLHEKPINLPGLDIINKSPDGPVFDLSIDTDNLPWGTAYVRAEHVMDMAKSLGMVTLDVWEALQAENEELKAQVNALPQVVRKFYLGLDRLLSEFDADLSKPSSIPSVPVVEEPEVADKPDGESAGNTGQSDSTPIDKRPDKLSGSTGNELDSFGFSFPNGS